MVPHLATALTGPINELEQRMLDAMPAIERWFRLEWMEHTPPFYTCTDIRNAGFKLAAMETSLFPTGWNHLSQDTLPLAVQAAMAAIEKICPEARNLLIILENQWQGSAYLANIAQLQRIFNMAGLHVRIGSINPDIKNTTTATLDQGASITLEPVIRSQRRLGLHNFDPCTILLSNNLSAGIPGILEELHEQYLLPPLHAGWSMRRKTRHLQSNEDLARRLGKMLGMDPWLIHPLFAHVVTKTKANANTDIRSEYHMQALCDAVDTLLTKVRRKYKEYGIHEKPFVLIKTEREGTGMHSFAVRDVKALEHSVLAGQLLAHTLFVQEGVPTQERVGQAVAEPVVYMLDRYVVGGFYRLHSAREADHYLPNTPDTRTAPLAFAHGTHLPRFSGASTPNRFYMYGVIARLAMLAASYELEASDPEAETYR